MGIKKILSKDLSTEAKIKAAAKKLFTQKGLAATRTRDIAQEAGINLALLNYYFRSKDKLFEIVMRENVLLFLSGMLESMQHSEHLNLEQKLELLIDRYIDMLIANPDLPFFILSISRTNGLELDKGDDPLLNGMKGTACLFLQRDPGKHTVGKNSGCPSAALHGQPYVTDCISIRCQLVAEGTDRHQ
ncbi:MAG: helix-turn-helix transcriptional regulator [Sphingobacteriales bacterium]|nr:helix-turn-helix transcriptional regulator [Sphingobacteriales bacterium]